MSTLQELQIRRMAMQPALDEITRRADDMLRELASEVYGMTRRYLVTRPHRGKRARRAAFYARRRLSRKLDRSFVIFEAARRRGI